MEIFCLISLLVASVAGLCFGIYLLCNSSDFGGMTFAFSLIFFIVSLIYVPLVAFDAGKVDGLVESGKYEIVTHNDYSMKELQEFKKVGDHYLKNTD